MATPVQKQYIQFAKRVATVILIFWCAYRLLLIGILILRPSLAEVLKYMLDGVDSVMMVSIGFYTGNSVIEKGILKYFDTKKGSAEAEADQNG